MYYRGGLGLVLNDSLAGYLGHVNRTQIFQCTLVPTSLQPPREIFIYRKAGHLADQHLRGLKRS
jgi:hypothetical protein